MRLSDKTPSVEEYIPLNTLPRSGFWQCRLRVIVLMTHTLNKLQTVE